MKKKLFTITILLMLLTLAGCSNKTNNNSKSAPKNLVVKEVTVTMTDEHSSFWKNTDNSYQFRDGDRYTNEDAANKKKGSFNGFSFEANYDITEEDMFTTYATDIYLDSKDENIEYGFKNDSGELLSYKNDDGLTIDGLSGGITEENITRTVTDLASEYIDTDTFTFEINTHVITREEEGISSRTEKGFYETKENEEATYVLIFYYMVDGIKSFDQLEYTIKDDGTLYSFYRTFPDTYSKDNLSIDADALNAELDDYFTTNISEECTLISKEKADEFLSIGQNGEYIVLTFWNVRYECEGSEETEIVTTVTTLE